MALGQFGTLVSQTNSSTYAFSLSNDFGMNTILKTLGKASFNNSVVTTKPDAALLENTAEEGHVNVSS